MTELSSTEPSNTSSSPLQGEGFVEHFDVLIIGAGLSGVGAAFHLQTECPRKTYVILEAREAMGGTWDLFRYPGVRSDSDMYTLGLHVSPVARSEGHRGRTIHPELHSRDGGRIRHRQEIRYRHACERAKWSSSARVWTVDGRKRRPPGEASPLQREFYFPVHRLLRLRGRLHARLPGRDRFRGRSCIRRSGPRISITKGSA